MPALYPPTTKNPHGAPTLSQPDSQCQQIEENLKAQDANVSMLVKAEHCFICLMSIIEVLECHYLLPVSKHLEKPEAMQYFVTLCPTCHKLAHRLIYGPPGLSDYSLVALSSVPGWNWGRYRQLETAACEALEVVYG